MPIWTSGLQFLGRHFLSRETSAIPRDSTAVAVYLEDSVVGHVPFNPASYNFHFLSRETNKAFAEVTGGKVNRGAGYGLKIPCLYKEDERTANTCWTKLV